MLPPSSKPLSGHKSLLESFELRCGGRATRPDAERHPGAVVAGEALDASGGRCLALERGAHAVQAADYGGGQDADLGHSDADLVAVGQAERRGRHQAGTGRQHHAVRGAGDSLVRYLMMSTRTHLSRWATTPCDDDPMAP